MIDDRSSVMVMVMVIGHGVRSGPVIGPVMGHRGAGGPVMPGKKTRRRQHDPGPPFFYLSIYIAPHEIFWPFWLKNKVLTSDNKAVRNSGMTLNYL